MKTGNIKIWWTAPKNVDSFNIYHALEPFSKTALPSPAATNLSSIDRQFLHKNQDWYKDHYYRVALFKNGKIYLSNGIKISKHAEPTQDYIPTLSYTENENHDINLTWTVPNPPDSYNIYHSLTPFDVNNLPEPLTTGITTIRYTHSGRNLYIGHYYAVAAIKDGKVYLSNQQYIEKITKPESEFSIILKIDNDIPTPNNTRGMHIISPSDDDSLIYCSEVLEFSTDQVTWVDCEMENPYGNIYGEDFHIHVIPSNTDGWVRLKVSESIGFIYLSEGQVLDWGSSIFQHSDKGRTISSLLGLDGEAVMCLDNSVDYSVAGLPTQVTGKVYIGQELIYSST